MLTNDYLYELIDNRFRHFYSEITRESFYNNLSEYKLGELVDCVSGYAYSSSELVEKSNTALVTIKNFNRSGGFVINGFKPLNLNKEPKINQNLNLFDLIVAHTDLTQAADIIGNPELVTSKSPFNRLVMSSDIVKIMPKYGLSTSFLYALLKQKSFKSHAKGYSSGTTVLHLNKKCIPEYSVLLPSNLELIKPLSLELEKYVLLISQNIEICNVLRNLRNELISLFLANNK